MRTTISPARQGFARSEHDLADGIEEPVDVTPWINIVVEKVKTMRYGVVQIVVHDSRVVQIERTERTRFEVPQSTGQR